MIIIFSCGILTRYFEVMKSCWKKDANLRPTFESLIGSMDEIAEELMPNYRSKIESEREEYYYPMDDDFDDNGYLDIYEIR